LRIHTIEEKNLRERKEKSMRKSFKKNPSLKKLSKRKPLLLSKNNLEKILKYQQENQLRKESP
jgi:hypothetical protein